MKETGIKGLTRNQFSLLCPECYVKVFGERGLALWSYCHTGPNDITLVRSRAKALNVLRVICASCKQSVSVI